MPDNIQDWQAPPQATQDIKRLGWLNESCEDGLRNLKSNRGYSDYRKFMDVIAGKIDPEDLLDYRSAVNSNELKTNMKKVISAMAKLRPIWGYSSGAAEYSKNAEMMNKVARHVYLQTEASGPADRSIKKALQWSAATTRGYVRPVYRRDLSSGKGNIYHLTYGNPSVLRVQEPTSGNLQEAYTVHIMEEMPIYQAHAYWPEFQDKLKPTSSKYWHDGDILKASKSNQSVLSNAFGFLKRKPREEERTNLLLPIRYSYIIDLTLNQTDAEIPMGESGTTWFYRVPFMGQQIVRGGKPKIADENDCKLYPLRRLMISTENCILYDGTSFDWHGLVPLVPFSLDEWAWGDSFSLVHDGYELQRSMTAIERGSMDKIKAQLDIPLGYDINSVTKKEAEQFDPMQPRARVGFDGMAGDMPFKEVVPKEVYQISGEVINMHEMLGKAMKSNFALNDLMQLAQARALGSGSDNIEQILGNVGPIIEDMSRSMEPAMAQWGEMEKYNIIQYFDTSRVMRIVGQDNVSEEFFDYHPDSLIPSHLPGESVDAVSTYTRIERAKNLAANLPFSVTPHSIHELTQMSQKLLLIQLKAKGVKISSQTIAEACNIHNYGNFGGSTEVEKWEAEMEHELMFAARMKEIGSSLPGMTTPGAAAPGKNPEGRPSTEGAPPKLVQKDGGARSTIATSR